MTLLEVKNLTISFGGLRAVDDFNIEIKKGQLYGLIGPNGAGKTTTIRIVCGLLRASGGTVKIGCLLFLLRAENPSNNRKSKSPPVYTMNFWYNNLRYSPNPCIRIWDSKRRGQAFCRFEPGSRF